MKFRFMGDKTVDGGSPLVSADTTRFDYDEKLFLHYAGIRSRALAENQNPTKQSGQAETQPVSQP